MYLQQVQAGYIYYGYILRLLLVLFIHSTYLWIHTHDGTMCHAAAKVKVNGT